MEVRPSGTLRHSEPPLPTLCAGQALHWRPGRGKSSSSARTSGQEGREQRAYGGGGRPARYHLTLSLLRNTQRVALAIRKGCAPYGTLAVRDRIPR